MDERRHSRGQRNLYEKMLRKVAEKQCPSCGAREITSLMDIQHKFYKQLYNEGKSTSKMSKTAFHLYYETCQRASILMFGVSGMDEDDAPFDHGGITE